MNFNEVEADLSKIEVKKVKYLGLLVKIKPIYPDAKFDSFTQFIEFEDEPLMIQETNSSDIIEHYSIFNETEKGKSGHIWFSEIIPNEPRIVFRPTDIGYNYKTEAYNSKIDLSNITYKMFGSNIELFVRKLLEKCYWNIIRLEVDDDNSKDYSRKECADYLIAYFKSAIFK